MLVVYFLFMYVSNAPQLKIMHDSVEHNTLELWSQHTKYRKKNTAQLWFSKFMLRHSAALIVATSVITFAEDRALTADPGTISIFYIAFEVVSAYSGVGLSVGAANGCSSLCGGFDTLSATVISLVSILGKFRGLPPPGDATIDFKSYFLAEIRSGIHGEVAVSELWNDGSAKSSVKTEIGHGKLNNRLAGVEPKL